MAPRMAVARLASPMTQADHDLIRWYVEDYRDEAADPGVGPPARRASRRLGELGTTLFRDIFEASQDTRRLWAAVQPDLASFRVEIVTDVPGATALPWETMTDTATGRPLALDAAALVRAHPQAARAPRLTGDHLPVRVLLVISRPGTRDVPFRSVARHLARLQEDNGATLRLDVLRPPTFAQLTRTLQEARNRGQPYQVVHFDGHGIWADAGDGQGLPAVIRSAPAGSASRWLVSPARPGAHGYLLFEHPQLPGNLQLADGPAVGNLLADCGVPLLVLNACRSALAATPPALDVADPHAQVRAYGSLAQEVMDTGVAGVLAMRYEVYVATAARFVADLYTGLLQGWSFGTAVRAARQNLAASPPVEGGLALPDWMVPVAYEAAPLHLVTEPAPAARPAGSDSDRALPARSELGFYGRDDTLLALDRAFDTQPIVLLHGEPGIGKTATAAEFARWYRLTGGVAGPVLYTSVNQRATAGALDAELTGALADDYRISPIAPDDLPGDQHLRVIRQIMQQVPLLWIWDDLEQVSSQQDLLSLLRSAPGTQAKLLLISRDDQRAWLGDLPARRQLPPLPVAERAQLVRAVAARQQARPELNPTSSALGALGGNPKTIIDLTEAALRAGRTSSPEFERFLADPVGRSG